jgi:hypothetical protein
MAEIHSIIYCTVNLVRKRRQGRMEKKDNEGSKYSKKERENGRRKQIKKLPHFCCDHFVTTFTFYILK